MPEHSEPNPALKQEHSAPKAPPLELDGTRPLPPEGKGRPAAETAAAAAEAAAAAVGEAAEAEAEGGASVRREESSAAEVTGEIAAEEVHSDVSARSSACSWWRSTRSPWR